MRILITTDWYKPAVNGVVTSVLALRRGLEMRGHDVRILTLSQDSRSYIDDGVIYQASHGCSFIYQKARFSLRLDRFLLKEIMDWQPDIIHSQCEFSTFRMARKIAVRCNIPIVHTFHTDYEYYTRYCRIPDVLGKFFSRLTFRRTARHVSSIIVPTAKTARMVSRYGIKEQCFIVPSGIDTEKFSASGDSQSRSELRCMYGLADDDFVLLYLGRVAEEKNIDELMRFSSGIEDSSFRLVVAGDGPYRERAESLAHDLGMDGRVVFTGMVPPEMAARYYHMADAFATASTSETQGLCIIEALASSLPVICCDDPVFSDVIIPGYNGFAYSCREDFTEAVSGLLEDREKLCAMAGNAGYSAQRFSVAAFAGNAERIYQSLICHSTCDGGYSIQVEAEACK